MHAFAPTAVQVKVMFRRGFRRYLEVLAQISKSCEEDQVC
jgi:hypothetical protein